MGTVTVDEYFADRPAAYRLYRKIRQAIEGIGKVSQRVSKSQIAFRRKHAFARISRPDLYLRGKTPPLVLSVALRRRDASPRWKELVEPAPGRFMHHLEIEDANAIDSQVGAWLAEAWEQAG